MTSPLSGAFKGVSYKGAFGNDAQALGSAFANMAKGRRDEDERRRQAALDAVLQQMKADELGLRQEGVTLDREQLGLGRERLNQDQVSGEARLGLDRDRLTAEQADEATRRGETERHNRAMEETLGNRLARGWKPTAMQGPGGEIVLVDASEGTVSPTRAAGGVPTNAEGAPVGSQARPSPAEREAASTYETLQGEFDRAKTLLEEVDYATPDFATAMAQDVGRQPRTGVISSVTGNLGNIAMGKLSPEQQKIAAANNALTTVLTKMITGAQMSEPEAVRIRGLVELRTGDTPETVQEKLGLLEQLITAQRGKMGRAATSVQRARGVPADDTSVPGDDTPAVEPDNPKDYYDMLRDEGLSPAEAKAETLAKFPNASEK